MDYQNISIAVSDEVSALMEERGVREEDIREVVAYAESTGKKLYNEDGHFLARKRLEKFSAYVEYTIDGDAVNVFDVYSHMVTFEDEK